MKKSLLLLAMALISLCNYAQDFTAKRVAPAPPKFTPWAAETEAYMWNVALGGFFINHQGGDGAPYYGTAASLNDSIGTKVIFTRTNPDSSLEADESEAWSVAGENTYLLVNYVTKFKENRCAFADGWMWTDNNTQPRRFFDVNVETDGTFTFTGNFTCIKIMDAGLDDIWTDKPFGVNNDRIVQLGEPNNKWALVAAEDYEAYMTGIDSKIEILNVIAAANSLRATIESTVATYEGIDISAALAVYNNEAATKTELDSARTQIIPAITKAYLNAQMVANASVENPYDATGMLTNPSFEDGTTGWTFSKTNANGFGNSDDAQAADNNKGTYHCDNADGNRIFNIWAWGNPITQKVTGVPNGIYAVSAMVSSSDDCTAIYITAETKSGKLHHAITLETNPANGTSKQTWLTDGTMYAAVTDGTLTVGAVGCDADGKSYLEGGRWWYKVDNFRLSYLGNSADAWAMFKAEGDFDFPDFPVETTVAYKKLVEDYNAAKADFDESTDPEKLAYALEGMVVLSDSINRNIEAYAGLQKVFDGLYKEANSGAAKGGVASYLYDIANLDETDDGAEDLAYLYEDIDENKYDGYEAIKRIEYAPAYVLAERMFNQEEVLEYAAALQALWQFCNANSLEPGTDFTSSVVDADFSDKNGKGWTGTHDGGNWGWTGGFEAFPVAESWHGTFDIHQDVKAPDGIYSVSLNGFCGLDNLDDTPTVPAEIYINDFATKLQSLEGGAILAGDVVDGFNAYLTKDDEAKGILGAYHDNPIFAKNANHSSPNNATDNCDADSTKFWPQSMEGASIAFSGGRYQAKVYGIVEGGTMRIGVRNKTSKTVWVLWSNFKLTYEGITDESVAALAESVSDNAQAYLDENIDNMNALMINAVEGAIDNVKENNGDTDGQYKAIIELNKVVNIEAPENVTAVKAFNAAAEALTNAIEEYESTATDEAINTASEYVDVAIDELTTEEIKALTAKINDAIAALRIPRIDEEASDDNPIDMTAAIVNPDFEANNYNGWTLVKREGASGNYQTQNGFDGGKSMEFWSGTNGSGTKFDFYQRISHLPAGTYKLSAYITNSYNGQSAGPGTGAVYLYAGAGTGDNMKLVNGDAVTPQAAGCTENPVEYSVIFNVAEGEDAIIGLMNVGELSARWAMVDDFSLEYYGTNSEKSPSTGNEVGIDEVDNTVSAPVAIYSISGAKLTSLKKGINIVKGADGQVKKVFIK